MKSTTKCIAPCAFNVPSDFSVIFHSRDGLVSAKCAYMAYYYISVYYIYTYLCYLYFCIVYYS